MRKVVSLSYLTLYLCFFVCVYLFESKTVYIPSAWVDDGKLDGGYRNRGRMEKFAISKFSCSFWISLCSFFFYARLSSRVDERFSKKGVS